MIAKVNLIGTFADLTYVVVIVLKGCVITRARLVWPRARHHATLQNDFWDISYMFGGLGCLGDRIVCPK